MDYGQAEYFTGIRMCAAMLFFFTVSTNAQTRFIYGIHDFEPRPDEFTSRLEAADVRGVVTATEAVGHNPTDTSGKDYRSVSSRGHTVISRLNNGYFPLGTIPVRTEWNNFAARCASFASASQGCTLWVIGNETNLSGEWPAEPNGYRKYISPEDYADCFRRVYNSIKAVCPTHLVIPQALAPFAGPYGSGSDHDAMPIDHVTYMRRMLEAIQASGGVDGIALHIPSRGYSRAEVFSTQKVNGNYWSFFCYKDWIERGIPQKLWSLPVYATESNGYYFWKGGHPEAPARTYEPGWVKMVLLEIDRWNHNEALVDGKPIVRSLNFYRWCSDCDGWNIDGTPQESQILADLDEAAAYKLEWPDRMPPGRVPFTVDIEMRPPPLQKEEAPYLGVWRSWVFNIAGTNAVSVTFELSGAAANGSDDDDARLLVDSDDPAVGTTWNTTASLDGSRDQGATATAAFSRSLSPGQHVLRLQIDGTPFIQRIRVFSAMPPADRFVRGDANSDAVVDLSDAVATLFHLFADRALDCLDAADSDDSGVINVTDVLSLLGYLFKDGPPPAAPAGCDRDATSDDLDPCAKDRCP